MSTDEFVETRPSDRLKPALDLERVAANPIKNPPVMGWNKELWVIEVVLECMAVDASARLQTVYAQQG